MARTNTDSLYFSKVWGNKLLVIEDAKLIREGKLTAINYTTNYPKRFKRLAVIVLILVAIIQIGAQKPIVIQAPLVFLHCLYLCYYCMISAVCRKSYFTVSEKQLSFIYQYRLETSVRACREGGGCRATH